LPWAWRAISLVLAGIRFLAGLASAFVMIFTSAIVFSHGLGRGQALGAVDVISGASVSAFQHLGA
jgi:hypothetical protein